MVNHLSTQPGHLIATVGMRDISGESHSKVADVSTVQVLYHERRLEFWELELFEGSSVGNTDSEIMTQGAEAAG